MLHLALFLFAVTGPCTLADACETQKKQARVLIRTEPSGAEVFMDGRERGVAPVELEVTAGSILIGAENGDQLGAKRVVLEPSTGLQPVTVALTGEKTTLQPRPYRPSWSKIAVGMTLVSTAVVPGLVGLGKTGHFDVDYLSVLFIVTGGLVATAGLFPDIL